MRVYQDFLRRLPPNHLIVGPTRDSLQGETWSRRTVPAGGNAGCRRYPFFGSYPPNRNQRSLPWTILSESISDPPT